MVAVAVAAELVGEAVAAAEVGGEAVAEVVEVAAAKEASRPSRRLLLPPQKGRVPAHLRAGLLPLHRLSGRKSGQARQTLQAQTVLLQPLCLVIASPTGW